MGCLLLRRHGRQHLVLDVTSNELVQHISPLSLNLLPSMLEDRQKGVRLN